MPIKVGDKLPQATLKEKTDIGPINISVEEFFDNKRIVLFAVPGAFTPTCSMNHLPGFLDKRDDILAKGIDDIAVVAVNDWHVMGAWAKSSDGEGKIHFLSDWNADFTKKLGLDMDLSGGGLGVRSKRYSMVVDDGVVTILNIEENAGQAVQSGADALLEKL